MQLYALRRTHVVPEDKDALRRLGRSMGIMREPVAELEKQWRRHGKEVRRLHESSSNRRCSPPWPGSRATRPG